MSEYCHECHKLSEDCDMLSADNNKLTERVEGLEALLRELTDIEGPQPGHVMWYRKVQEALGTTTSETEVKP